MAQAAIALAAKAAAWYGAQGALTQAIIQVAAFTAANVAVSALTRNAPTPQGQLNTISLQSDPPRRLQIGRRGNAGVLVDAMSSGFKNQQATMIIYLGEGQMGPLRRIWSGGHLVFDGTINHGVRTQLTEFDSPDGRCWVTYYDGRPGQTNDPTTTSDYASRWPATKVGTGCAYIVLAMQWDPDTMPVFPRMIFETEGAYMYDRRLDSTAGGSGSHRLKDPSTWEPSTNPVVALDHFFLGRWLNASDKLPVFGVGLDPALVDFDRIVAAANIADENVSLLGGGTQKRYSANGFMFSSDIYKDTILDLCRAFNARPADFGGLVSIVDNEAKAAVMTLTDDDVIEKTAENYTPKRSRNELLGSVIGTYQDPSNNFYPAPYPEIRDAAWETEDGGVLEPARLDLDFETSSERAQRLATAYGLRERRQAHLTGTYAARAMKLEDGDWYIRSGRKFPGGKLFEVIGSPKIDPQTLNVTISGREVDTTDSAWDNSGVLTPNYPIGSTLPNNLLPIPLVTYVAVAYIAAGVTIPAVTITNTEFDDDFPLKVEYEIAFDDSLGGPMGEYITGSLAKGQQSTTQEGLAPSTNYVIRWRGVAGERTSDWSAWDQFTTTDTYSLPVKWADVNGPGRPADNADVTADNFANGIIGEGDLARLDSIDWNNPAELANRPSDENLLNQFILAVAASILPNYSFASIDTEGKASGIEPLSSITDRSQLETMSEAEVTAAGFQGNGIRITSSPDVQVGYGWPAIPIDDRKQYQIYIRHRSSAASGAGLTIRMAENNTALETGKTHLSIGAASSLAESSDTSTTLLNNGAMPGTSATISSFLYTPTTGTEFASLILESTNSFTGDYEVDFVAMTEIGNHDIGADVTGVNFSSGFFGEGDLAREDRASRRTFGTRQTETSGFVFTTQSGDVVGASDQVMGVTNTASIPYHLRGLITSDGGPVEIEIGAWFDRASPGTTSESPELRIFAQVRRDGVNQANYIPMANLKADGITDGQEWWGGVGTFIDPNPPAGVRTYEVRFWCPWTSPKSPFPYNAICYRNNLPYLKLSTYEDGANDITT